MNYTTNLINGSFEPENAGKILFALINSKINYHNLETLTVRVQQGLNDEKSLKRIEELNNSQVEIMKILEEAKRNNKLLKVSSTITIEYE
jgi:hypothetical protein